MANGLDTLYRSVLSLIYQGQLCQNVLWFRAKEASPYTTQQLECDAIDVNVDAWFVSEYQAFANAGVNFTQLVTQAVNGPEPVQTIRNYQAKYGAIAGEGLPPHDAVVVSLYTPFHGKRLHGRIYLTGISESDQNGGVLTAPSLARLNTIGTDLMTRFKEGGSFGGAWGVVFSRKNGMTRNPGPPPMLNYSSLAGIPWTRYTAHAQLRTQRHRRLPY